MEIVRKHKSRKRPRNVDNNAADDNIGRCRQRLEPYRPEGIRLTAAGNRSHQNRLSALPDDLLVNVLTYLEFTEVCANVSIVSRRMQQCSTAKRYTNTVHSLVISGPAICRLSPLPLYRLFSRLGRLQDLTLSGCGDTIDDEFLKALGRSLTGKLQRLDVDWCGSVSDIGINAVVTACPGLLHFTLFKGRSRRQHSSVTDHTLKVLSRSCPQIEYLCLTYTQITKKGIEEFADTSRMNLVKLLSNRSAQSWGPTSAVLERRRPVHV